MNVEIIVIKFYVSVILIGYGLKVFHKLGNLRCMLNNQVRQLLHQGKYATTIIDISG